MERVLSFIHCHFRERDVIPMCPVDHLETKNHQLYFQRDVMVWYDAIFVLMFNPKFKSLKELSSVDSHRYIFILLNHQDSAVEEINHHYNTLCMGFPRGTSSKEDVGDVGSIPGSGRCSGGGSSTAIHFSILAWRIPWTEEPGGLQSIGSQRVRHD